MKVKCRFCKDVITRDHGTWIDTSGGDVCGVHSVADGVEPNTNQPHAPEGHKKVKGRILQVDTTDGEKEVIEGVRRAYPHTWSGETVPHLLIVEKESGEEINYPWANVRRYIWKEAA